MKYKKLLQCLLFIICLCVNGCQQADTSIKDKTEENDVIDKPVVEKTIEDSIPLEGFDGYDFTPIAVMENGWIVGNLTSTEDGTKKIGYIDIKTNKKNIIKELDFNSESSGAYYIDSSDKYLVFVESVTGYINTSKVYVFSLETSEYKLIYEREESLVFVPIEGTLHEKKLYLNYPEDIAYQTHCFDLSNNTSTLVVERNSSAPVFVGNEMYYLDIDNEKRVTTVISEKGEISISMDMLENSFIRDLKTDGRDLYLFIYGNDENHIPHTICIKYDLNKNTQEELFRVEGYTDSAQVNDRYITWWNPRDLEEGRIHTKYSLYDLKNREEIEYKDSVIWLSKDSMLWTKFNKDQAEIEKGKIFSDNNSTLMYLDGLSFKEEERGE